MTATVTVDAQKLLDFSAAVYESAGMPAQDARLIADDDERSLVARIVADRRNLRDRFAF